MRALQTGALGDARHAAVLTREQVLEVNALERFARLAVRPIESDFRERARGGPRSEYPLHFFQADFLVLRAEREILHHAFQLREIARPDVVTQGVERRNRKTARRAGARLDQLGKHERGEVRHILGELAY